MHLRAWPLFILLSVACGGSPSSLDAGADASSFDAGADAGPLVDPGAARFVAAEPSGEGPWGVWGFMTVSLGPDRAIVLGGTDATSFGGLVFDSVWSVSIGAGTLSATAIEATGPAPRYCGCAAYDPARDVVLVFGGRDLTGPALAAETWELSLADRTWTRIEAAAQPRGVIGCAMAYADTRDAIYLFGGASLAGPSSDTYRYDADARTWVRLDATGPLARYDGVLLSYGDELLLFGGSYGATGPAFYADFWRFDPSLETWTELTMAEPIPPGRRTAWIVRDPARDGLYVGFGYDGMLQPYGDLWYADLDARTWTAIPLPDDGPPPRGFSPALPGGPASLGTLIGGNGARNPVSDAWQLVR
jgi:hypothetical protein